jgi:hypothetical protein
VGAGSLYAGGAWSNWGIDDWRDAEGFMLVAKKG